MFGAIAVLKADSGLPRLTMMAVRGLFSLSTAIRSTSNATSIVDVTDVALGAGHGDSHARLYFPGEIPGPDHRGYSQFAGDDRRVTGSPAMIGDDGGRDLHHGLPIRARGWCDKHFPRLEPRRSRLPFISRTLPVAILSPTARPVASTLPEDFKA